MHVYLFICNTDTVRSFVRSIISQCQWCPCCIDVCVCVMCWWMHIVCISSMSYTALSADCSCIYGNYSGIETNHQQQQQRKPNRTIRMQYLTHKLWQFDRDAKRSKCKYTCNKHMYCFETIKPAAPSLDEDSFSRVHCIGLLGRCCRTNCTAIVKRSSSMLAGLSPYCCCCLPAIVTHRYIVSVINSVAIRPADSGFQCRMPCASGSVWVSVWCVCVY